MIRHSSVSTAALAATLIAVPVHTLEAAEGESQPTPVQPSNKEEEGNITVTATRTPVLIEEAPATVAVITDEQIADQLASDVRDLVRYEPGVTVRRAPARFGAALGSTGRARNEDFTIRGIGGNRVLIQVDGIRSPQGFSFGAQDVGRGGSTDISLVKQVEILRGPASALYGSDGLAGAVSFTTADPVDLLGDDSFGGFVRSQFSSADNEFANTVTLAAQSNDFSGFVAYTRRDFKELENQGDPGDNDGIGSSRTLANPQDGESNAVLGKLVWNNGEHRIRLTGEYLETEVFSDVQSGLGPVFLFGPVPFWNVDRLEAEDTTERVRGSLDWTYSGDEDDLIEYVFVTAYYQDGKDTQFTEEDRTPIASTSAPDRTRLNTFDNEVYGLSLEARSGFSTGSIEHTLSYGGDISETRQEGLRDGTVPPTLETFPARAFPVTDFTLGGIYIADEISIANGVLTLFPALRYDFYDLNPTDEPLLPNFDEQGQSDDHLSPKIGVTFKPVEDVILFGNYTEGFRAPTPSQVNNFFENLAFGYRSLANPDLGPETSESWELGARYVGDIFSLQAVYFDGSYDDFIVQQVVSGSGTAVDPSVFQFVNLEGAQIDGIEIKASMKLDNGISGNLAVAYADGDEITADGSRIPLDTIDPFNLVAGLGYKDPQGRFGADFILTYTEQKELAEVSDANLVRPSSSTIFDITAFYAVTDELKLRVGVFNLFDENYAIWSDVRGLSNDAQLPAFTRPGRNVSASVSFQF